MSILNCSERWRRARNQHCNSDPGLHRVFTCTVEYLARQVLRYLFEQMNDNTAHQQRPCSTGSDPVRQRIGRPHRERSRCQGQSHDRFDLSKMYRVGQRARPISGFCRQQIDVPVREEMPEIVWMPARSHALLGALKNPGIRPTPEHTRMGAARRWCGLMRGRSGSVDKCSVGARTGRC
jgi:hypothetical protein